MQYPLIEIPQTSFILMLQYLVACFVRYQCPECAARGGTLLCFFSAGNRPAIALMPFVDLRPVAQIIGDYHELFAVLAQMRACAVSAGHQTAPQDVHSLGRGTLELYH